MQTLRPLLILLLALGAGFLVYYFVATDPGVPTAESSDTGSDGQPDRPIGAEDTQQGKTAKPGETREAVATDPSRETPAVPVKLRGRLVFSDGVPAVGVAVEVHRDLFGEALRLLAPPRELAESQKAQSLTGPSGGFEMEIERLGKYWLDVASDEVVLAGEHARGLRVELKERAMDLGEVLVERAATIRGQVIAGGRGVEGVEIVLGTAGASAIIGRVRAKTDAEGKFTVRGVRPGKVKVGTRSSSYLPAEQEVEVAAGQRFEGLTLELRVGGVIVGTVVDDRGKPIEGAKVVAARAAALQSGFQFTGFRAGESTVTDASGRFRLAGLAQKTARVRSTKDGFVTTDSPGVQVDQAEVVLEMNRLAEVRGVLVDEKGTPIAGSRVVAELAGRRSMSVMIIERGGSDLGRTDEAGRFVVKGVRPGSNRLIASGDAHVDAEETVQVTPGSVLENIRIVARLGATMTVSVVDQKGRPVADAAVVVETKSRSGTSVRELSSGGRKMRRTFRRSIRRTRNGDGSTQVIDEGAPTQLGRGKTDADGKVTIRGLPPGLVVAKASHKALALHTPGSVEVPDGGAVVCRIRMEMGGFADVSAVDMQGQTLPMTGFEVTGPIEGAVEKAEKNSHTTDSEGRAQIGPLRPGSYRAVIANPAKPRQFGGGMSFSMFGDKTTLADSEIQFVVKSEQTALVRLVRPILTTVRGIVRDAEGVVKGAEVELTAEGELRMPFGGSNKLRTDAEGRFEITDMPSGKYKLSYGRRGAPVPAEMDIVLAPNQPVHEEDLRIPGGVITLQVIDEAEGFGIDEASVTLRKTQPKTPDGAPAAPRREARIMFVGLTSGSGGGGPSSFSMTSGNQAIKTDAKGRVSIRGIPPGSYGIAIRHKDYAKFDRTVILSKDQKLDLGVIKVAEGCKIRGRVKWEAPPELAIASVEIADLDGKDPNTTIAQGGSFKFEGLRPGVYRLRARPISETEWGAPQTVQVAAGDTERITLTIPAKK